MWDIETGECVAHYRSAFGSIFGLCVSGIIAAGTAAGMVEFLSLENLEEGCPVLTATRLWVFKHGLRFGSSGDSRGHWDGHLTVFCPFCGRRFAVRDEWIGQEIACPLDGCGKPLKLNSFVCDNSDWLK